MAQETGVLDKANAKAQAIALQAATKMGINGFRSSLEMKENADSVLTPALLVQEALADGGDAMTCLDSILELNAPLCQTHVVLLTRHWVSVRFHCIGVVWAEPHVGSLNFPIYPPTLNLVSDPNQFAIQHQILHMYDGVYRKPIGQRGPFMHRFNVYPLSDIRFAEQEALDLKVCLEDVERITRAGRPRHESADSCAEGIGPAVDVNEPDGEWMFDVPRSEDAVLHKNSPVRMKGRSVGGRVEEVSLLDGEGKLLKRVQYEYGGAEDGRCLVRQTIFQPERMITVGFAGEGPTITINGEKRRYSQLETVDLEGGRKCVVDYQPVEIGGRMVAMPSRIEVYTGDGKGLLRRVRMSNVTACDETPEQVESSAEQFSLFDANELLLRELLIKYWLKAGSEIAEDDIETLGRLRRHFREEAAGAMTPGEQLKRVNMLLETDWMLDDPNGLEEDFREYVRLLRANDLGRMVLYGGENLVETTAQWGQPDAADRLLPIWLDAAVAENDMASILDFVSARLTRGSFWTSVKLLEKALAHPPASREQQFVGQAFRCIALSQIDEMAHNPDHIKTELGVAQARWVLYRTTQAKVREELMSGLAAARKSFDALDQPTRQDRLLKQKLDTIDQKLVGDGSATQ